MEEDVEEVACQTFSFTNPGEVIWTKSCGHVECLVSLGTENQVSSSEIKSSD